MLIIYGIRTKEHPIQYIHNVFCKNCGHTNHTGQAITRYAHLFWIPFFITSRPLQIVCDNCGHIAEKQTLPKQDLALIKQKFFNPLNTLPFFIGIGLVLFIALFTYLDNQETKQQELTMLEQPQINDVYLADFSQIFTDVDMEGYNFGALKITSLEEDGVSFAVAKETYNTEYGLQKRIRKAFPRSSDYYDDSEILISYEGVRELYNSGAFISIRRVKTANQ